MSAQMMRVLQLIIIWMLCQPALAQQSQVTIPGLGISLLPNAPVPEGFAEKIAELLFPSTEWQAEGLSFPSGPARAYQVNYARGGGIITVDRLGAGKCLFSIKIERPGSARIRHYVMIGTDLTEWEIIRRDPPSSVSEPFARTLLLQRPNTGRLRGFAFYDGTWAELECYGLESSEATRDSMLRLTWNLAQRLHQAYGQYIAPIAKSLDDGSAEVTRPDLPDPDARPDQPTRKPKAEDRLGD
jgi:hypothetical protein